jgi:hypothetical protein
MPGRQSLVAVVCGLTFVLVASLTHAQTNDKVATTHPVEVLQVPDAVTLVFPPQDWRYLIGGGMDSITFIWRSQPGVTHYMFDTALDSLWYFVRRDSTLVDTVARVEGFHTIMDPQIRWRVRAANVEGWGSWSEVRRIRLGITALEEDPTLSEYSLLQNYPNPFNSSTKIRYGIPVRSQVSLVVYNALGQRVTVLQNGEQEAGYHDVKFDAAGFPSGVYYYRVLAGTHTETKKLILAK